MNVAILIPARLDGVRLPRKVLMDFFGLPMVEHVRRRAELATSNPDVYVVSGDQEVLETVADFQGKSIKTFAEHENGTSRCAEAAKQLNHRHFIVAQGDEILLLPRHLNEMINELTKDPGISMLNCVAPLKGKYELFDESIVKCLIGHENKIVMMFRSPPNSQPRDDDFKIYHKVLGLFAFDRELLSEVSSMSPTNFEQRESIEQMRLLENGVTIKAFEVEKSYPSVNVTKDISEVLKVIELDSEQNEVLKSITHEIL
jgi:3-deoxy-manno-octulosonate cytidylyltransferase (CMP-KDO synthetase)